jgi:hypothetical protein
MPNARDGAPAGPQGVVRRRLRRFYGRSADGAPEQREVKQAGGSDVGADSGARSATGNADDPPEHGCCQKRDDRGAGC